MKGLGFKGHDLIGIGGTCVTRAAALRVPAVQAVLKAALAYDVAFARLPEILLLQGFPAKIVHGLLALTRKY